MTYEEHMRIRRDQIDEANFRYRWTNGLFLVAFILLVAASIYGFSKLWALVPALLAFRLYMDAQKWEMYAYISQERATMESQYGQRESNL